LSTTRIILAADTIVAIDGDILGKPGGRSDAIAMLQRLSAATHQVITSVTVRCGNRVETALVETVVQFRAISLEECSRYWLSGEPADKAGAYGIQGLGSIFIERLSGSYSNVVGLPLTETAVLLGGFGLECLPQERRPQPTEEQNLDKDVVQNG
jgi:septum formation protein